MVGSGQTTNKNGLVLLRMASYRSDWSDTSDQSIPIVAISRNSPWGLNLEVILNKSHLRTGWAKKLNNF